MAANDYAVVVGINHYPNPPLSDLQGPENDALGFKDWLVSPTGGAVPDVNIHLILSRDFPAGGKPMAAKPTTGEVDLAFEEILEQVKDQAPARRLYMFFAGHGIAPPATLDEAALLTANAGRNRMGHNIPGKMYARSIQLSAMFQEVVLFMDCCRDNYVRGRFHNPTWDETPRVDAADTVVFTGFATKWSRKSREKALEDQGPVQGLFSHAVLTALRGGRLTGSQLRDRVHNHLRLLVPDGNLQEPKFEVPDPDILFSEDAAPPSSRVTITFVPWTVGKQVVVEDGKFKKCREGEATAEPWEIALDISRHRIRETVSGRELIFDVLEGNTNVEF